MAGRFAVAQVHQEQLQALPDQLGGEAAHEDLDVVWVGADGQNVVALLHGDRLAGRGESAHTGDRAP
jgi:hypothetical protein